MNQCLFFPDVIHTVGPIGENEELLHSAYKTCLQIVRKNKLRSVVSYQGVVVGQVVIAVQLSIEIISTINLFHWCLIFMSYIF